MDSFNRFFYTDQLQMNHLELITRILEQYNCRSNEVLSAKWKNFYPDKFLILESSKKSANVIVRDKQILSALSSLHHYDNKFIFPFVSYYQLYRYIKKNYSHLINSLKKRQNQKVTHAFRYESVKNIDNDEKIRDILHHRSIKSGKYYKNFKGDS